MKKGIRILAALGILSGLAACSSGIQYESVPNDSLELTSKIETEKRKNAVNTIYHCTTTIKNVSEDELMYVSYVMKFYDGQGNELISVSPFWSGQDKPLKPGESVTNEYGFQDEADQVAKVVTELASVKTTAEMPPVHLPEKGEPLYTALNNDYLRNISDNPPIRITGWIDHMGARDIAVIEDPELIEKAVKAFKGITIGDETEEWVTDNYNGMEFEFADGGTAGIGLNLYTLEISVNHVPHLYKLNNLSPFWSIIEDNAVPETYED